MNSFLRIFTLVISIGAATQVSADESIDELKKSLAKSLPQFDISYIDKTPIEGVYQVIIGGQVIYMTKDARYMIDGNLIDLSTKKNYTEDAMSVIRLSQIEKLGEDSTPGKIYQQRGCEAKALGHYEKSLTLWKGADPGISEVEDARKRLVALKGR